MTVKAIVEIRGDAADISPVHPRDRGRLAALLVDAAGDRRREVRTRTSGAGMFSAPLDIVRAAGLLPDAPQPAKEEEPSSGGKAPAKKTAARKPAVKADTVAEAVDGD